MAPIRVAIIGLSSWAKTSWAATSHLPYLLSDNGRAKYKIVALCNSSKAAAENAIKAFGLPPDVKAYGSPHDLAADPDVELVVVNTRVDVHYDTVKPSIEAGKDAYVEWPLAHSLQSASELADLARSRGVRTVVSNQARLSPPILKVNELLQSGAIGKVLSADVRAFHSRPLRKGLSEGLEYFTDSKIGGNNVVIALGHTIDFVHSVLGEYSSSSVQAGLEQRKVDILAQDGAVLRTVETDVPDVVMIHGLLQGSDVVRAGATLSLTFRRDPPPFPDEPAFWWAIYGEKGQLRVTLHGGTFLNADSTNAVIRIAEHGKDEYSTVEWNYSEWQQRLPSKAQNTSAVYERFADGKDAAQTFDTAVVRHRQIEAIFESFRAQNGGVQET